jgi:DNA-3-methyladenine glycosylase
MKLAPEFYLREDVITIARELLGKILFTNINGHICSGIIYETEAYNGIIDKASHAYGNRYTKRTEVMYRRGGCSYIYLCYGVHSLFNVVTNIEGVPHAVLVRGLIPQKGTRYMKERLTTLPNVLGGPGILSKAMGLHYTMTGVSLLLKKMWIEDNGLSTIPENIISTPRVGVDFAGIDAALPYRFVWDYDKDKQLDL